MANDTYTSLGTLSADGNTSSVAQPGLFSNVSMFLDAAGATFGGGTLKAQVSPDNGTTWLDVPSASFTSGTAGTKKGDYTVIGTLMRWNLAGSTSPTLKPRQRAREVREGLVLNFTFTGDGSTAAFQVPRLGMDIAFLSYGTWGSGTLAFQVSPDGGTTWLNVDTLTANGIKHILAANNQDPIARLTLSGSTAPSLTAQVYL